VSFQAGLGASLESGPKMRYIATGNARQGKGKCTNSTPEPGKCPPG